MAGLGRNSTRSRKKHWPRAASRLRTRNDCSRGVTIVSAIFRCVNGSSSSSSSTSHAVRVVRRVHRDVHVVICDAVSTSGTRCSREPAMRAAALACRRRSPRNSRCSMKLMEEIGIQARVSAISRWPRVGRLQARNPAGRVRKPANRASIDLRRDGPCSVALPAGVIQDGVVTGGEGRIIRRRAQRLSCWPPWRRPEGLALDGRKQDGAQLRLGTCRRILRGNAPLDASHLARYLEKGGLAADGPTEARGILQTSRSCAPDFRIALQGVQGTSSA